MRNSSLQALWGGRGATNRFSVRLGLGLAAIFIYGYAATVTALGGYALPYCFALLVIFLSTQLMLCRLDTPSMEMAPLWLCWSYFIVAYCVKFFLILLFPSAPAAMGAVGPLCQPVEFSCLPTYTYTLAPYNWTTLEAEAKAITLAALCISAFCLAVTILPVNSRQANASLKPPLRDGCVSALFILALLLSGITAFLFYRYQIGAMGSEVQVKLPYKMRGIVFYARTIFLPGLLLLIAALAWARKSYKLIGASIGLLLINGALDVVLRSSRGALLSAILMLIFFVFSARVRVSIRAVLLGSAAVLPIFVTMPYISAFRVNRLTAGVWDAMASAIAQVGLNPFHSFAKGIEFVFYRFTGVDVLASILGHEATPIGHYLHEVLMSERGVSGYLSTDIFGVATTHPHAAAPGFVGWCYLVAGVPGVVFGGAALAIAVKSAWDFLLRYGEPSGIVARIFFLSLLFTAVSEGTVDTLIKPAFAMAFSVLLLDLGMRVLGKSQSKTHRFSM